MKVNEKSKASMSLTRSPSSSLHSSLSSANQFFNRFKPGLHWNTLHVEMIKEEGDGRKGKRKGFGSWVAGVVEEEEEEAFYCVGSSVTFSSYLLLPHSHCFTKEMFYDFHDCNYFYLKICITSIIYTDF